MKDMLKTGRVVQTRDGAYGIVLGNGISFEKEYLMRSSLNNSFWDSYSYLTSTDLNYGFESISFDDEEPILIEDIVSLY